MFFVIAAAVIVAICAALLVNTFSCVRAARLERNGSLVEDRELFAAGAKAASKRQKAGSHSVFDARHATAWEKRLHAAGLNIAPRLCAVLGVGVIAGAGAMVFLVSGQVVGGIAAMGISFAVLQMLLSQRERKRRALFDMQLAETLPRIAASVRGSLTLERALRVSIVHMEDPLREEFVRVLADAAYGMPLHEALESMAYRTQSADVKTLAAATKLRRSRGGSVATALAMISSRVNARLKSARELRTEIASTRMAKWFVAAAMPAIFSIMYFTNADFARFYTESSLGWMVLGIAAVMEVMGLLIAHRVTTIDV